MPTKRNVELFEGRRGSSRRGDDNPTTGIIRTLPSLYATHKNPGYEGLMRSIAKCERDESATFFIALGVVPTREVLHLYLCLAGEIKYRFTLAGFSPGTDAECWDQSIPQPKIWAVCTGPIEKPPQPMPYKGFQGFKYTAAMW